MKILPNRTKIGIIASVRQEADRIIPLLKEKAVGNLLFFSGGLEGKHIALAISGMGKTNAAHAASLMAQIHKPSLIINIGIGGAYPSSGLKAGDIAVAESEIYGDEGVMLKDGFHGTDLIGIPLLKKGGKRYFNKFPLDRRYADRALRAAQLITHNSSLITVRKGTFLTLSTCTGTKKRALELEGRFGAICENMEGAAVAHICALYGVAMIEFRGVSNIVEDRDRRKWGIGQAAENCQAAVLELLKVI